MSSANPRGIARFSLVRIVLAILATCLPIAIVLILAHQIPDKALRAVWPQLLAAVLGVAGYLQYVRRIEGRPALELGRLGLWRELGAGMAFGGFLLVAILGILAAAGSYRILGVGDASRLAKACAEMLVVALAEEIVFRGVLFRIPERALGTRTALILSSVLFALAHLPNEHITVLAVANTAAAGLMFGAAYLATRRLWLPVGIHFAWNFLLDAVFSLPTSGYPARGLLLGRLSGPEWLSGGDYGVEASAVTLAALAAATGVLMLLARRRRQRLAEAASGARGPGRIGGRLARRLLRQQHQAGTGQAVVQELAVLVEEGREAPGRHAGGDRHRHFGLARQAEHGADDQRRQEPAPGQQVAQHGAAQRYAWLTDAGESQAPGFHGQRVAAVGPAPDEIRARHQEQVEFEAMLGQRRVAVARDQQVERDGQHLDGQQQEGFIHHDDQAAPDGGNAAGGVAHR
jgi:membrane protease YdiL (CAAX protease family)